MVYTYLWSLVPIYSIFVISVKISFPYVRPSIRNRYYRYIRIRIVSMLNPAVDKYNLEIVESIIDTRLLIQFVHSTSVNVRLCYRFRAPLYECGYPCLFLKN